MQIFNNIIKTFSPIILLLLCACSSAQVGIEGANGNSYILAVQQFVENSGTFSLYNYPKAGDGAFEEFWFTDNANIQSIACAPPKIWLVIKGELVSLEKGSKQGDESFSLHPVKPSTPFSPESVIAFKNQLAFFSSFDNQVIEGAHLTGGKWERLAIYSDTEKIYRPRFLYDEQGRIVIIYHSGRPSTLTYTTLVENEWQTPKKCPFNFYTYATINSNSGVRLYGIDESTIGMQKISAWQLSKDLWTETSAPSISSPQERIFDIAASVVEDGVVLSYVVSEGFSDLYIASQRYDGTKWNAMPSLKEAALKKHIIKQDGTDWWFWAMFVSLFLFIMVNPKRKLSKQEIEYVKIASKIIPWASLPRRAGAFLIDQCLISVPVIAMYFLYFHFSGMPISNLKAFELEEYMLDIYFAMYVVAPFCTIAYMTIAETIFGHSLGKLIAGITVVNLDGSKISFRAAFVRNILRLIDNPTWALPGTIYIVGFAFFIMTQRRQRLGDIASKTVVVLRSRKNHLLKIPEKNRTGEK